MWTWRRTILLAWLAYLLSPLLRSIEEVDLDRVKEWGLKGPSTRHPVVGVYLFVGLPIGILFDTSHCRAWDPVERSLVCPFDASASAFVGTTGEPIDTMTSPVPPLSSTAAMRFFSLQRYCVRLTFNADLTVAHASSMAFGTSLVGALQELFFVERLEKAGHKGFKRGEWLSKKLHLKGAWVRNNYAQGLENKPGTGYVLLPVLTPEGGLNKRNLRKAKEKLGAGTAIRMAM